jgi:hypothetical protein
VKGEVRSSDGSSVDAEPARKARSFSARARYRSASVKAVESTSLR